MSGIPHLEGIHMDFCLMWWHYCQESPFGSSVTGVSPNSVVSPLKADPAVCSCLSQVVGHKALLSKPPPCEEAVFGQNSIMIETFYNN